MKAPMNMKKRKGSRSSSLVLRKGSGSHAPATQSIPGLSNAKWNEILQQEESDNIVLEIREEIISNCLEMCYQKYLKQQVYSFTVHCAYHSWTNLLNMYFLSHDPIEPDMRINPKWLPDKEVPPSHPDSFTTQDIPVLEDVGEPQAIPKPPLSHTSLLSNEADRVSLSNVSLFSIGKPESNIFVGESKSRLEIRSSSASVQSSGSGNILTAIKSSLSEAEAVQKAISGLQRTYTMSPLCPLKRKPSRGRQQSFSRVFLNDITPSVLPANRIEVAYTIAPSESRLRHSTSNVSRKSRQNVRMAL